MARIPVYTTFRKKRPRSPQIAGRLLLEHRIRFDRLLSERGWTQSYGVRKALAFWSDYVLSGPAPEHDPVPTGVPGYPRRYVKARVPAVLADRFRLAWHVARYPSEGRAVESAVLFLLSNSRR